MGLGNLSILIKCSFLYNQQKLRTDHKRERAAPEIFWAERTSDQSSEEPAPHATSIRGSHQNHQAPTSGALVHVQRPHTRETAKSSLGCLYPCFLPTHGHLNASDTNSPPSTSSISFVCGFCESGSRFPWPPDGMDSQRPRCCPATFSGPLEKSRTSYNCTSFLWVMYRTSKASVSFEMFEQPRFVCPHRTTPLTMTAVSHSKTWG